MTRLVPPAFSWVCPSRGCLSAWPVPVVVRSAFRAGSLRLAAVAPSSRSFSRAVVLCFFACPASARVFAARWSARCRVSVAVRPSPPSAGAPAALWCVSVPVPVPPPGPLAPLAPLAFPGARSVVVFSLF